MLYPITTESRVVIDLSGIWQFKLDDGRGFEEKWYEKPLEDPLTMPVPCAYNDMKEDKNLRDHYGWVFYQKELFIPKILMSQRIVLRIEAAVHKAIVYLNGRKITEHKGGFLPFEVEINDLKENDNLLTIAVDNRIDHSTLPVGSENFGASMLVGGKMITKEIGKRQNKPNFDFFNYAGLIRPVKIYTSPWDYIEDIKLITKIEQDEALISYEVLAVGEGSVSVSLMDESGKFVCENEGATGVLKVKNPNLWQPLKPYLYQCVIRFNNDCYTLPYGLRTVQVEGGKFLINGEPFRFKGYGKHEDTFPAGRGLNEAMNVKDISLMKWQGANSFRTSHYPYSEEMMRLCDREGIVVIDETPAVGLHLNF